jgi:hypothetical protein
MICLSYNKMINYILNKEIILVEKVLSWMKDLNLFSSLMELFNKINQQRYIIVMIIKNQVQ